MQSKESSITVTIMARPLSESFLIKPSSYAYTLTTSTNLSSYYRSKLAHLHMKNALHYSMQHGCCRNT